MTTNGNNVPRPARSMRDFYAQMSPKLITRAYLMCGNLPDAEDAVQEAFTAVLAQWERYSRYETPEAVVHRAMVQRVWKMQQRRARWLNRLKDIPQPGPGPDPHTSAETSEVLEALRELPPRQRTVLVLHALEGLSSQEIADELEISVETVRGHKYKARESLKLRLGLDGYDADRPGLLPETPEMVFSMLPPNPAPGGDEAAVEAVRRAEEELYGHFAADRTSQDRILAALEERAAGQGWALKAEE